VGNNGAYVRNTGKIMFSHETARAQLKGPVCEYGTPS
jgi:hypothetical protein